MERSSGWKEEKQWLGVTVGLVPSNFQQIESKQRKESLPRQTDAGESTETDGS